MKKISIIFLMMFLSSGIVFCQKKVVSDLNASSFISEMFRFLEEEGMNPFSVNDQHLRFMRGDKQYNLVVYDGKPSMVRLYTDYANILPLSDTTNIVIRKPDGVNVTFLDKTYRLSTESFSLDVEPFKYDLYRQLNLMNKVKVYFNYPDPNRFKEPELTYDRLNFTRSKIGNVESFNMLCSDGKLINFNMIQVKGGTFEAGNPEGEHKSETVSDFYICETEVSRRLWELVMGYVPVPYKGLKADVDYPVNYISWNDAKKFIDKLNTMTGLNFRFPTEAEWEYAARGGEQSKGYKYSGSNKLQNVAFYVSLTGKPAQLKSKSPNELGLYDMSGNVAEWCDNGQETRTKPARGGSYSSEVNLCKVYETVERDVDYREASVGLRLAMSVE